MSDDRWDSFLERDWSSAWDSLPEAPQLVARSKSAQITLRLPSELLDRIRRVGATRSLPHHALVRSWLVDALRQPAVLPPGELPIHPRTEQLNIKLDQDLLDRLKKAAHDVGRPYHRLARQWIEAAVDQEERLLGLSGAMAGAPGIKELIVLLLHATDQRSQDTIHGITRLQKLLFVIKQTVGTQAGSFYAYNYGPFDEGVNDAARALELAGFLEGSKVQEPGPPSFAEMMATASERAGPNERRIENFVLNEDGHALAERLRQSSEAYEQLFERIRALRTEWDTPDLIDRVYQHWPEYAERSLIRDEVGGRRAKRRPRDP